MVELLTATRLLDITIVAKRIHNRYSTGIKMSPSSLPKLKIYYEMSNIREALLVTTMIKV